MAKFTLREIAIGVGLKLTSKKHLRRPRKGDICLTCRRPLESGAAMYVTLGERPLARPIECGTFTINAVPYIIHTFCLVCARNEFPADFKKEPGAVSHIQGELLP